MKQVRSLDGTTTVVGVIGNPVGHSLSPRMHNAAFASVGINFIYVPFLVNDVENAIAGIRALNIRGVSVTIPFKREVIPYLDEIDSRSRIIGSVNTIVNEGGKLRGFSSDGAGAMRALREKTDIAGKRIWLLGNGGSALAIVEALLSDETPASLVVAGRNPAKTEAFVRGMRTATGKNNIETALLTDLTLVEKIKDADIVINTTPVGMHPHTEDSPLPNGALRRGQIVFDIVYNPAETKLIAQAKKAGCAVVYGYAMLAYQAAVQFEAWTGRKAPQRLMRNELKHALIQRKRHV